MTALRRLLAVASIAALSLSALPASAGFFDHVLKRPTATPPPEHKPGAAWDWIGKPSEVTFKPTMTGISYEESCRWVDFNQPYHWKFTVVNHLKKPVTFKWAPFPFQKDRIYGIATNRVHTATLAPGAKTSVEGPAPLGCPNMRGGQSTEAYYYVIGDDAQYAGSNTYLRSGFFADWNRQYAVLAQKQARQEADAPSLAQGMSTAFSALTTMAAMACSGDEYCENGDSY